MATKTKAKSSRSSKRKPRARKAQKNPSAKLPKDAVTLVVILRAKEGQELLMQAELGALLVPTRKEEGCLVYDLHRAADAGGSFFLHEVWASRDAHAAHTRTPHFVRWNARKDAMLASREVTFWKKI